MKKQLKIIGTMVAIVLALVFYVWLLSAYPDFVIGFFAVIFALIILFVFYAAVASHFEDQN